MAADIFTFHPLSPQAGCVSGEVIVENLSVAQRLMVGFQKDRDRRERSAIDSQLRLWPQLAVPGIEHNKD